MTVEYVSAPEPCSYPVGDEDCGDQAAYFLDVSDGSLRPFRVYRCRAHAGRTLPRGWQVVSDGHVVIERALQHRDCGDETAEVSR